ncbi:hypothetical protein TanjilG_15363 [Lupinus angustifolius]|uniref:Uncharacterized protein n=1 Tax=Lupinus angustifolius TaxID=3871 RepID=A0A1J7I4H4_LUPAN|nr:PREDICTED: uncharacterized protein LOC109350882 [Lupinus angustifolius]OIW09657.1 hypothetical protein TanjilG_15363 [Lupinus angustifolius]
MGNCLKHQSYTKYTTNNKGGDYNFSAAKGAFSSATSKGGATCTTTNGKTTTEVKIKITKKQLEELLGKVDMRELRVEQVLAQLMNHSREYESFHKPWRPSLQSIPEMN